MGGLGSSTVYFPSKFLESPIIHTAINRLATYPLRTILARNLDKEFGFGAKLAIKNIIEAYDVIPETFTLLSPSQYPVLYRQTFSSKAHMDGLVQWIDDVVTPIVNASEKALADAVPGYSPQVFMEMLNNRTKEAYMRMLPWEKLVNEYDRHRSLGGRDPWKYTGDGLNVVVAGKAVFIKSEALMQHWYLTNWDVILMIKDCMYARANTMLASSICYPDDDTLPDILDSAWAWMEACLTTMGNAGFEVAKSVESLSKTYLSRMAGDPLTGPNDSYARMKAKVINKQKGIYIKQGKESPVMFLATLFEEKVLKRCATIQQVVEVFGLQKMVGHPIVCPYTAGESVQEHSKAPNKVLPSACQDLRATFCRLFTESYIAKHKEWPELKGYKKGSILESMYSTNNLHFNKHSVPLSDWEGVRFGKLFEFNYYVNFLDVLDDKAISYGVKDRLAPWDKTLKPSTERRLLLEILKTAQFNIRDYIQEIEDDKIPADDYIISTTLKEREMKLCARVFAMFKLGRRVANVAMESNIAEKILPYIPQLTMTDDKLTVHKRFLTMLKESDPDRYVKIMAELDLERWNLQMREAPVNSIGKDLNDLFGMKRAFTFGHQFFSECIINIRTDDAFPESMRYLPIAQSALAWTGHEGGFEGIMQKLWSIVTVAMIDLAISRVDLSYTLTIQGDNVFFVGEQQRNLALTFPNQAQDLVVYTTTRSETGCLLVNQILKPEECIESTTVGTYSKNVYVRGVDYPTTLKSLSRLFPTSPLDFPAPSSFIKSIGSGAVAAAENCKRPVRCYYVGLVAAAIALRSMGTACGMYTRQMAKSPVTNDPAVARFLLIFPSDLGGIAFPGLYSFFYKGGPDPGGKALASLKMLAPYLPQARAILDATMDGSFDSTDPTLSQLIADPYSFPLKKPKSVEDSVSDTTLDAVTLLVKNVDIKQVLRFRQTRYRDSLELELAKMTPFNPVIAHDLVDASVMGTVNQIGKMFLTTRTIQALTRGQDEGDILSSLSSAAMQNISHVVSCAKAIRVTGYSAHYSVFQMASILRERWNKVGVSPVGVTSYLPIDFKVLRDPQSVAPGVELLFTRPKGDPFYVRGSSLPYLGQSTREKRADQGYKIVSDTLGSSALKTLAKILSWSDLSSDFSSLIDEIGLTRSDIKLSSVINSLPAIVGGNSSHRYGARAALKDGHLLGQSNLATHCMLSSDRAGFLSATEDDYPIMFQVFFLHLIAVMSLMCEGQTLPDSVYLRLSIGDTPLVPLPTDRIRLSQPRAMLPALPTLPKLVYDPNTIILERKGLSETCGFPFVACTPTQAAMSSCGNLISKAMTGAAAQRGVLDHVTNEISIPLGVLEISQVGLSGLINLMALAILDSIQGMLYSRSSDLRGKVGAGYIVFRMCKVLYPVFSRYLSHPLLKDDPLLVNFGLGDSLSYMSWSHREKVFAGVVSSRVMQFYRNLNSPYYTTPVVHYASDQEAVVLSNIISIIRRAASYSVVSGDATHEEAYLFVSSGVLMVRNNKKESVETVMRMLYDHYTTYSLKPKRASDVNIALEGLGYQVMTNTWRVKLVRSRGTAEDALRMLRRLGRIIPPRSPRVSWYWGPTPLVPIVLTETQVDLLIPPTEAERAYHQVIHNLGLVSPLGSGALVVWLSAMSALPVKESLIIGSGLGGCAVSLIALGAPMVFGLDLRDDLPKKFPSDSYFPPLVLMFRCREFYSQCPEAFSTSGNIFDIGVASKLASRSPGIKQIILDIPGELPPIEGLISSLQVFLRLETIIWRVAGSGFHIARALGIARVLGHVFSALQMSKEGDRVEMIIGIEYKPPRLPCHIIPMKVSQGLIDLEPFTGRNLESFVSQTIGHKVALMGLLLSIVGGLGGVGGHSVRECLKISIGVMTDLITGSVSEPRYAEWTEFLHSTCVCEILLRSETSSYAEMVSDAILAGYYTFAFRRELIVQMTPRLVKLLVGTGSRLVGRLDERTGEV